MKGRVVSGLLLALLMVFGSAGCATKIYPPLNPPRPVAVYVCDYGVHSSLLLPSGGGQYVEYVYGDWDFAALNETDPFHTLQALFHSPQAALGRRFLRADPGEGVPLPPNRPHSMQSVFVDAEKEKCVVQELDERYRDQIATAYFNDEPDYDYLFVKDTQHYGICNNCNSLTERELKKMGCTLRGQAVLSKFDVMPPLPPEPIASVPPATPVVNLDAAPH